MARAHNGYDVYLGSPASDTAEHSLSFPRAVLYEDINAKTLRVRVRDERRRWITAYELTDISTMQRNGTAIRWTGTAPDGSTVMLSGISNRGGCIPCSRR